MGRSVPRDRLSTPVKSQAFKTRSDRVVQVQVRGRGERGKRMRCKQLSRVLQHPAPRLPVQYLLLNCSPPAGLLPASGWTPQGATLIIDTPML